MGISRREFLKRVAAIAGTAIIGSSTKVLAEESSQVIRTATVCL